MKIADFGLARNVHEDDYYRKTTDVSQMTMLFSTYSPFYRNIYKKKILFFLLRLKSALVKLLLHNFRLSLGTSVARRTLII